MSCASATLTVALSTSILGVEEISSVLECIKVIGVLSTLIDDEGNILKDDEGNTLKG